MYASALCKYIYACLPLYFMAMNSYEIFIFLANVDNDVDDDDDDKDELYLLDRT
jgi:hypothetical protein